MIDQIYVLLQIIHHKTSPKVQQIYIIIDTTIQNPGLLHWHINSPCEYWPPSLSTTNSYLVYIINLTHLVGTSRQFVVMLTLLLTSQKYLWIFDTDWIPWTVEAMITTLTSFQRAKIETSSNFFTQAIYPRGFMQLLLSGIGKFLLIRFSLTVPVPP